MEDLDLELLRGFRAEEAEPRAGMQERLEEDLWQVVLEEEARIRSGGRRTGRAQGVRGWLESWSRPLAAAGMAGALAVGVAVWSQGGTGSIGNVSGGSVQASANVFDTTANTLFGSNSTTATTPAIATSAYDMSEPKIDGEAAELLGAGPTNSDASSDFATHVTRDPETLRDLLRASVDAQSSNPAVRDREAFDVGMNWIVNPSVPGDLRAAVLRSLDGLDGIDRAVVGSDVLGRTGVVLSHFDSTTGVREQYVLARQGGTLLERRGYTTAYVNPACPPGTFVDYALFDDGGLPVDAAQVPWAAMPDVIPACGP